MRKGSHRTEAAKEKQRKKMMGNTSALGCHWTEAARKKKSEETSGGKNPMYRKPGYWLKKRRTVETREKIGKGNKGKKRTEEFKQKIHKSRKGKFRGSDNPNWKGGRTSLAESIRTCFEYRQWRSDIFTRDDFTCQKCYRRGGWLHAHHKKAFALILELNDITTLEQALECSELWDINNGVTYCKKCHDLLQKNGLSTIV